MEILHRHGIGYCAKCSSRSTCQVLCSEAEAYAGQDFIEQKEVTIGLPTYNRVFLSTKTNEEIIIYEFFSNGMKQSQIAKMLDISRQYVSKIVIRYRKILLKNLQK